MYIFIYLFIYPWLTPRPLSCTGAARPATAGVRRSAPAPDRALAPSNEINSPSKTPRAMTKPAPAAHAAHAHNAFTTPAAKEN